MENNQDETKAGSGWKALVKEGSPEYTSLTEEKIRKVVEGLFKSNTSNSEKREIVGLRSCLTRGWIDINDASHCGDKSCSGCNLVSECIEKECKSPFTINNNDPLKKYE